MSLAQLSSVTYFSKGYLSRVENGRRSPTAKLARCCDDALEAAGQLAALRPERPAIRRGDVRPAQLPADLATFAGRAGALARLDAMLPGRTQTRAIPVTIISGGPGTGKSALALHWGHRVANEFPDGQLFVNLGGSGPGPPPAPAQVLGEFLAALGDPTGAIPVGPAALAAKFRSVVAGRRLLLVLDDAVDTALVQTLLPGSSGCFVVITSRRRLTRLVADVGARPVPLDRFTGAESRDLLMRHLGPQRIAAEPHAVQELITLSGYLPGQLALAAARVTSDHRLSLADLVSRLRGAADRPVIASS